MSLTGATVDLLGAARRALQPQASPMREIAAKAEGGLAAAILIEASETILPRLLTLSARDGRRMHILAGDQRVYQVSDAEGRTPSGDSERIISEIRAFSEALSSASITSATPAIAMRPAGGGHDAAALLSSLRAPTLAAAAETVPPSGPSADPVAGFRAAVTDQIRGFAVLDERGAITLNPEDPELALGELLAGIAAQGGKAQTFLDQAIPGPKLVLLGARQDAEIALAYGALGGRVICASFDIENLTDLAAAWARLAPVGGS